MKPFNDITSVITEMQNALACATRIFDLLEEPEEEVVEKVEIPKTEEIGTSLGDLFKNIQL